MNIRSPAIGGTSKPAANRPNTAGDKVPSPRIVQQLKAQQRQQQQGLEFPQIVVNDQQFGLNITSASQTVAGVFPQIQGNSNQAPVTTDHAGIATVIHAPAGNKSPRIIVHPVNNNLNLQSVSADRDDSLKLGDLAPHNPQRRTDGHGPVTDADVIYNETRLAAMLAKQKQDIIGGLPQGVQGRSDAPGIQYRDRPKSAVPSRNKKVSSRGTQQSPTEELAVEAQPLAVTKAIEPIDKIPRPSSSNGRPPSQSGTRRSPREKTIRDPLVRGLQVNAKAHGDHLVIQGNAGGTDAASVNTSARESDSVRQLISASLQQYYEQQEANHPSIFEGIGAGLGEDDGSTINTVGGGSFPASDGQHSTNQWRELYEQQQMGQRGLPDGSLHRGIAIEDMDSQDHSSVILFDDDDSPRIPPQESLEAAPITPLPAPTGSIEEFLSQEMGSRPSSPHSPTVVNLANMVKDMLHPEGSTHNQQYQRQDNRNSISANLRRGILPHKSQIHKGRPLSSNALKSRPKSAVSSSANTQQVTRPSTAAGDSRARTRYLPELHVPTAQPVIPQPSLHFEPVVSGQNLGLGETLMDTISELLGPPRPLSTEQIRERLKRPLSPREAVMLMSHEIIKRREEIRLEKLWKEKRNEIPVTVVAPQQDEIILQHQHEQVQQLSAEERLEGMLPNELKQQMDRQLRMYRKMTSAPQSRTPYDLTDLTQSQVLRVMSTEPVPPRSVSPPQMRQLSFLPQFFPNSQPQNEDSQYQASTHEPSLQESSKVVRFVGDEEPLQHHGNEQHITQTTAVSEVVSPRNTTMRNAIIVSNSQRNEALVQLQQRYSTVNKESSSPIDIKNGEFDGDLENEYGKESEEEKLEIGLKWKTFLFSSHNPNSSSEKAMPILKSALATPHDPLEHGRHHVGFVDPTFPENDDIVNPHPNDEGNHPPPHTFAGSLLESALPAVRNEAFYVDNYDPTYLLKSPELMSGGPLEINNTSRPVSRGNYLFTYYQQQQERLKRQYDRPRSAKPKSPEGSPSRPSSSSSKWGPLPHEVKKQREAQKVFKLVEKKKPTSDVVDHQKDIVKINVNVASDRVDNNFKLVYLPFEATKVLQLNIPTYQHLEESDDESYKSLFGPRIKKGSSRGGMKSHPDSPKAAAEEALIPGSPPAEKDPQSRNRHLKEEEQVKTLLATTSIPLRSKKEEISARNNAIKYSKFISNRNKECKSVSWSKGKNPSAIAKEVDTPALPELTPAPPAGSDQSSQITETLPTLTVTETGGIQEITSTSPEH